MLSFVAIELVIVVLKLASSPIAAASSFNVLSASGDESTRLVIWLSTYVFVAYVARFDATTASVKSREIVVELRAVPSFASFASATVL